MHACMQNGANIFKLCVEHSEHRACIGEALAHGGAAVDEEVPWQTTVNRMSPPPRPPPPNHLGVVAGAGFLSTDFRLVHFGSSAEID